MNGCHRTVFHAAEVISKMNSNTVRALMILSLVLVSGSPDAPSYRSPNLLKDYAKLAESLVRKILNDTSHKGSPDNFVVSPISVAHLLSALSYAARGSTREEILNVLHMNQLTLALADGSRNLLESLKEESNNSGWNSTNIILILDTVETHSSAANLIRNDFHTMVDYPWISDYTRSVMEMYDVIRRSIERAVSNMFEGDDRGTNISMTAVNVAYFDSQLLGFHDFAHRGEFTLPNGESIDVPMIRKFALLKIHDGPIFKAVSMEFGQNKRFKMIVAMPRKGADFSSIPPLPILLNSINDHLQIKLLIPRFTIETNWDIESILRSMGVKKIFERCADSSNSSSCDDPLYLSSIIYTARVNFTGNSTATVDPEIQSQAMDLPFSIDRSFVVHILYDSMPLFYVQVTDPRPMVR